MEGERLRKRRLEKSSEQRCVSPFARRGFRASLYRLRHTGMLMFGKCIPFILETLFRNEEKGEREGERISNGKDEGGYAGEKKKAIREREKGRNEVERTKRGGKGRALPKKLNANTAAIRFFG